MCNMTNVLIFIGIIAITRASNITLRVNDDDDDDENKSIVCNIDFHDYRTMWSKYSWGAEYTNDTTAYFLVDMEQYANSFDEFAKKYPSVTIKTRGEAESYLIFGDVGRNKFGVLNYSTENFLMNNYVHFVNIIDNSDAKWGTYYVKVSIGVGFVRQDSNLFLVPYISGVIRSHGIKKRALDFGLTVETVTFNPYMGVGSLTNIPSERWILTRLHLNR
ncbi:hypothetical protein PV328_009911 [Microctonus aethiopoides]|uniref:Uncharacterized protein n=1 Tax=Microctonus aethiopoides TaxID=144406 RepID=A0AA39C6U0_9HYME|nr:hypothetical protein PV328_009911 [Microctonus aethiopoides]